MTKIFHLLLMRKKHDFEKTFKKDPLAFYCLPVCKITHINLFACKLTLKKKKCSLKTNFKGSLMVKETHV